MPRYRRLIASLLACWLLSRGPALAQNPYAGDYRAATLSVLPAAHSEPAASGTLLAQPAAMEPACAEQACACQACGSGDGNGGPGWFGWGPDRVFYGGADYLLIRPHFSQAVAFTEGTQTPTSFSASARNLDFPYKSNLRAFIGMPIAEIDGAIQFTYTRLHSQTNVNGTVTTPGQFIVDPFGAVAGSVAVFNPHDNLFGTVLTGGDTVNTRASISLNIYDIEYLRPLLPAGSQWNLRWSAGARIADINQYYGSAVSAQALGGLPLTSGDYRTHFLGAGPRMGFDGRWRAGTTGFSLFAGGHGSLLLGTYGEQFSTTALLPTTFVASQRQNITRILPVFETEVGGSWQYANRLQFSAGYLFQAWFDLGTSGGTFGGFFTGTDDSNLMTFDGLFVRSELAF